MSIAHPFSANNIRKCTVNGTPSNNLGFAPLTDTIEAELRVAMTQQLLLTFPRWQHNASRRWLIHLREAL